jgi:hypothetical protein
MATERPARIQGVAATKNSESGFEKAGGALENQIVMVAPSNLVKVKP